MGSGWPDARGSCSNLDQILGYPHAPINPSDVLDVLLKYSDEVRGVIIRQQRDANEPVRGGWDQTSNRRLSYA
jgi:hypothetical protein